MGAIVSGSSMHRDITNLGFKTKFRELAVFGLKWGPQGVSGDLSMVSLLPSVLSHAPSLEQTQETAACTSILIDPSPNFTSLMDPPYS